MTILCNFSSTEHFVLLCRYLPESSIAFELSSLQWRQLQLWGNEATGRDWQPSDMEHHFTGMTLLSQQLYAGTLKIVRCRLCFRIPSQLSLNLIFSYLSSRLSMTHTQFPPYLTPLASITSHMYSFVLSPGLSSQCLHSSLPYSQTHTRAEVSRHLWRLSRLTSLAKVGSEATAGCWGHCPVRYWISPLRVTSESAWATSSNVQPPSQQSFFLCISDISVVPTASSTFNSYLYIWIILL